MNTAYFSKISKKTSWNMLEDSILLQQKRNCKPLPFTIIAYIDITATEFDELSQNILKKNEYYSQYTSLSIASLHGIWQCIFIQCIHDSRNLLLYTAGNKYPLYASIINIY